MPSGVSFASPLYVWGAISLIVPILMLLARSQARKIIPFSSTDFLKVVTQKSSSVLEWKKILLLFIRLVILGSLVLAFSLPYLSKNKGILFFSKSPHYIIILDQSLSMGYLENGQSLLETAKSKIKQFVENHDSELPYYTLYTFHSELNLVQNKTKNRQIILNALEQIPQTEFQNRFSVLSAEVKKLLLHRRQRDLLLIYSDFSFLDKASADIVRKNGVETIALRASSYENAAIENIELPARPFIPGEDSEIVIRYRYDGPGVNLEKEITVWFDQKQIASQKVIIPKAGEGSVRMRIHFTGIGHFAFSAALPEDNLQADNIRYAEAVASEPVKVVLLEEKEYAYPFESPNFYLEQVLEAQSRTSSSSSWIELSHILVEDFTPEQFQNCDLLVINDLADASSKLISQIKNYVKKGGSVLMAFGPNSAKPRKEEMPHLTNLLGGYFGESVKPDEPGESFFIRELNYEHPIFKIFDQGRKGDFSKISVNQYAPFMMTDESGNFDMLMWLDNASPLLIYRPYGTGQMLLWTSSLNQSWSDFPKKTLYVPFIFELIKFAVLRGEMTPVSLVTGSSIPFAKLLSKKPDQISIRDPLGQQTNLYIDKESDYPLYIAGRSGVYDWLTQYGEQTQQRTVLANPDPAESRPSDLILGNFGDPMKNLELKEEDKGVHKPEFIYRSFFYLVFAFLFLEAYVANRFYKNRVI